MIAPTPSPSTTERYAIGRHRGALPAPRVEDVKPAIADLLPEFADDALRRDYTAGAMTLVLGLLRAREMFPRSHRFDARDLVSWHTRTSATLGAADAFDVLCNPEFAPLMPYAALSVRAFGGRVRGAIREIEKRLPLDPHGFSVFWIGTGGHVSPLHHDGDMVHGRWHLVLRGAKQFDFVPPSSREVPRLAPWDLFRRFSPLYKSPLPDAWVAEGRAHRVHLAPGQMVAWGRRWWHRVEIGPSGLTIGISTRGHRREEARTRHGIANFVGSRVIGEAEHYLDATGCEPPVRSLEQLRALCR
jgi:hypothetical protein